jgi:hypothetical protein
MLIEQSSYSGMYRLSSFGRLIGITLALGGALWPDSIELVDSLL